MERVYVVGHLNPDTDSVCSAISYAHYKSVLDPECEYLPIRAGELKRETIFVLEYFKVPPPSFLETLKPTVEDIPLKEPIFVSPDTTVYDIVKIMEEKDIKNVPVVENGKIVGVVSENMLARFFVRNLKIEPLKVHPVSVEELSRILNAEVVCNFLQDKLISGVVHIAIDALHVLLGKVKLGDVVVVGDDEPAQVALLECGAKLMIVTNKAPVSQRVIETAREKRAAIFRVEYDAFGVAKLMNLVLPASAVITKNFYTVTKKALIEDIRELVFTSKLRAVYVVSEEGKLVSVITRTDLMKNPRKKVILVDHNEVTQALDGITEAEILEIVDHHRIGGFSTLKPVFFYNEPVGSTSTIVANFFMRDKLKIEKEIAGLLLSGIVSDTFFFKSSTTTQKDIETALHLSKVAGVDLEEFAKKMLLEATRIPPDADPFEIVQSDSKVFDIGGVTFLISQVTTSDYEDLRKRKEEFVEALKKLRNKLGTDMAFVLFTNPVEEESLVLTEGGREVLEEAFGVSPENGFYRLKGVLSRKKDFVPKIGESLRKER